MDWLAWGALTLLGVGAFLAVDRFLWRTSQRRDARRRNGGRR